MSPKKPINIQERLRTHPNTLHSTAKSTEQPPITNKRRQHTPESGRDCRQRGIVRVESERRARRQVGVDERRREQAQLRECPKRVGERLLADHHRQLACECCSKLCVCVRACCFRQGTNHDDTDIDRSIRHTGAGGDASQLAGTAMPAPGLYGGGGHDVPVPTTPADSTYRPDGHNVILLEISFVRSQFSFASIALPGVSVHVPASAACSAPPPLPICR
jgi:hypothetical protein